MTPTLQGEPFSIKASYFFIEFYHTFTPNSHTFYRTHIRRVRTAEFGADRSAAVRFKLHRPATAMAVPVTAIKRFREL
jgi:hypothetical protein